MKKHRLILALSITLLLIFSLLTLNSCEIFCSHVAGEWIVDKEPDYHNDGSQHTICQKCGKTLQTDTIPHIVCEHPAYEWVIDKESSETETGFRRRVCKICTDTLDEEDIPKIELTLEEAKDALDESVVKVICYDYTSQRRTSQGSGFFIDESGTFITNAHVVKDAYYVKIKTHNGTVYDVNLMFAYNYKDSDYAILRAENCTSRPVEFEESVGVGEAVYAFGYPNDAELLQSSSGKILRTNVKDGDIHYLENSAEIASGSSGGILANSSAKVIGLTTGQLSNQNYVAVPYRYIKDAISKNYSEGKTPLSWFHEEVEVEFTTQNLENFFDLKVNASASADIIRYVLALKVKAKYAIGNFRLNSDAINITLSVRTIYLDKNNGVEINSTTNKAEFNFNNNAEIISGIGCTVTAPIIQGNIKNIDIRYEITYVKVHGSLILTN